MNRTGLRAAASLLVAIATVACSNTDASITARVKNKLVTDETVKTQKIEVATADKVVTLSGSVDSAAAKSRALALARETSGVVTVVDDRLTVTTPTTAAGAGANPAGAATSAAAAQDTAAPGMAAGPMGMHEGEMGMRPEMMRMGQMGSGGAMPGGAISGAAGTSSSPPASLPASALPGTPGVSHLYHIGSTGFFLDQQQITLGADQRARLEALKQRALTARQEAQERIQQAEQEMWALTGAQAGQPEIEQKVQEIERMRTNQRLEFIRAVGEATQVLTRDQQTTLLGTNPPSK